MRLAVISDIHGNRTAFEAVLADLRDTAPDLVFHGGDLADGGASPVEIVDQIRALGWPGVMGNGDEMLSRPESLREFAESSPPTLRPLFDAIEAMAAATREALGEERLAWLGGLPRTQIHAPLLALVHASAESVWRALGAEASDAELVATYSPLGQPLAVYAHIHRAFIRHVSQTLTIANTGSVSLSYDGDHRAAYLLLDDDGKPSIRRVEYDVDAELKTLAACGLPHAAWVGKMLASGGFQMP